jgi:predicted Zn finger-like uncharacterized protein
MILQCSQCSTRYVVQAASIPASGRKVKCARCGHTWHQEPATAEEQEIEITPQPNVLRDIPSFSNVPAFKVQKKQRPYLAIAAISSVVIALALLLTLIGLREKVVDAWTPSARLFSSLGLPVPPVGEGLTFVNVDVKIYKQPSGTSLLVSGSILNNTAQQRAVPNVLLTVQDTAKRPLLQWLSETHGTTLSPGESKTFNTVQTIQNELANGLMVQFTKLSPASSE